MSTTTKKRSRPSAIIRQKINLPQRTSSYRSGSLGITFSIPAKMRSTLEQAAELVGSKVNQFVVQSAYEEAQRILERETVIRLSRAEAEKVFALMENPPEPSQRLLEAVKEYKKNVRE